MLNRIALTLLLSGALVGCKTAEPAPESAPVEDSAPAAVAEEAPADPLRAAIDSEARPEAQKARDAHRHPYETLQFFGVQPDSTVVELWAGGGWYTGVLTPYIAGTGNLYVTAYDPSIESEYLAKLTAGLKQWLSTAENGDQVKVIELLPPDNLDLGLEAQADYVLTFRNIHNWVKAGYDKTIYEQAFKALKPGGIFGVVEHRGPEGMTREESAKSGYMDQAQVIKDIEAVGFEFVEASEVNANPKDTKDHPEGVWTLPPSLRLKDVDRAKYEAIGESDRMTLKFRKPQ